MKMAGEMSLSDTANQIPWFATGQGGAHIGNFHFHELWSDIALDLYIL